MDEENLNLVVENIFTICDVRVRTPAMTQALKNYISELLDM